MKTRTFYISLVLALLFLGAVVATIVVAKTSSTPSNGGSAPIAGAAQYNAPTVAVEVPLVQLDGKWIAKENNSSFVAEVKNNSITITIVGSEDTTMDYWAGSFKATEASGQSINSVVDEAKFVLSQDKNKSFTVGEDTLSFKFSAMGVSKTIVLHRA
jgi:hypothetical protein